jgi:DNA-directed RNA polymerase subunit RPC12/RpoP
MKKSIDQHCPGDDPVKKRFPTIFRCPKCGGEVEIWSDEEHVRCSGCKTELSRKDLETSSR